MGNTQKEYVNCKVFGNGRSPNSHGYFKRANGDLVYRVVGEVMEGDKKGEVLTVDLALSGDERSLGYTFEAMKTLGIDPQTTEDPTQENLEGKRFCTVWNLNQYQNKAGEWIQENQGRGIYPIRVKQSSFIKKQSDFDQETVKQFWGNLKNLGKSGSVQSTQSTQSQTVTQTVTQNLPNKFKKPGSKVAHKDLVDAEFESVDSPTETNDEEIPF